MRDEAFGGFDGRAQEIKQGEIGGREERDL